MPATPGPVTTRGAHVALAYPSTVQLARSVAGFVQRALLLGGSAVVLATAEHRGVIAGCLEALGLAPARLRHEGVLVEIDAASALEHFVVEGTADADCFARFALEVLEPLERHGGPIHIYGEMVAVLWDAGQVAAAVELEGHWNALAARCSFALLCGYPATSLASTPAAAVEMACQHHAVLSRPEPGPFPGPVTCAAAFAADLAELARVRRFVAGTFLGIGEEAVADAALVVTELAANAVAHAGTPFAVRLGIDREHLRIAVQDGAALSVPLVPTPGRGLGLVAALAERWGHETLDTGKVVWASIPLVRDRPGPFF